MAEIEITLHRKRLEEHFILELVESYCIESLDPETFEKWDEVKKALTENRHLNELIKIQ